MLQAAEGLRFEEAARLRDQLAAVEKLTEKQNIVTAGAIRTFWGWRIRMRVCVQVLQVRGGKLIGREPFFYRAQRTKKKRRRWKRF